MKPLLLLGALASALCTLSSAADPNEAAILALERQALDGWLHGNPDPLLAILDPDVTYFHVVVGKRLDGLPAVQALFEGYRGQPLYDRYEIADPKVQSAGDTAILTYILVQHAGSITRRWSATHVYLHKKEGWRVIHSHWSETRDT